MANTFYGASVNSFDFDPLQGQDAEVFFIDNSSGLPAFFGHLQSFTFSVRDSTETYLTLGTRHPTYLSGEIQIAWVAEQAMVDAAMLARLFGQAEVGRHTFTGRSPKFVIALDFNAQELINTADPTGKFAIEGMTNGITPYDAVNDLNIYGSNAEDYADILKKHKSFAGGPLAGETQRTAVGRIEFINCKMDSVSAGIMPGKRTVAQRLEGVAEGFRFVPNETIQEYKNAARRLARETIDDTASFKVK